MEEPDKAYIPKYEIQKGLAESLFQLAEIRGKLEYELATAEIITERDEGPKEELARVSKQLRKCRDKAKQEQLIQKKQALKKLTQNITVIRKREYNYEVYHAFMSAFSTVWSMFESQVTQWAHPKEYEIPTPQGKVKLPPTKDHLDLLFYMWRTNQNQPQGDLALKLHNDFIHSLKQSGIYNISIQEIPEICQNLKNQTSSS